MIISRENISSIDASDKDKSLVRALMSDLEECNSLAEHLGSKFPKICMTWQEWHNEYSPENLEAPDYYGCFRICVCSGDNIVPISIELALDELDTNMCTLVGYFNAAKELADKNHEAKD